VFQESKEYLVEQFNLTKENFTDLISLLNDAFLNDEIALEEGAMISFTEKSFDLLFNSPVTKPDLFVRAIHKPTGKIVGFLGNIPRTVLIHGKKYAFVIPGWLSVSPAHRRKGLATLLGRKFLDLIIKAGYDGGFALFEPEQYGKDITKIVTSSGKIKQLTIYSTKKFVVRSLDTKKLAEVVKLKWYEKLVFKLTEKVKKKTYPQVRLFKKEDTEQLYNLLLEHVERNDLAIIHDKEDFSRIVNHPLFLCVVHENRQGKIAGFIGGWEFLLAGFGEKHPCGWLDMVHIHNLRTKEATNLCNFLNLKAKEKGWVGIQTPYFPYYSSKPFIKAKFIFYGKKLFLDVGVLKEIDLSKKINSIFIDWR